MKRFATRVLPLALVLTLVLALPAAQAAQEGNHTVGVWAGYEFNNKSGDFSDGKWGIDYEYRLQMPMLDEFALGLELPFQYYSPSPRVQTNLGKFGLDTTVWTLLPSVKVYWLGLRELPLHPYVGAGVGWGHVEYDDPIDDSEDVLAWRVAVGAEYEVPVKQLPFLVFGEFEYSEVPVDKAEPVLAVKSDSDFGAKAVQGGLRFRF